MNSYQFPFPKLSQALIRRFDCEFFSRSKTAKLESVTVTIPDFSSIENLETIIFINTIYVFKKLEILFAL